MDDFFRSPSNGLVSHPGNRRFLHALFKTSCMRAGLSLRDVFSDADGGNVRVGALMERLGLPQSTQGWAASVVADLGPALVDEPAMRLSPRSLVIGWGLSPSLLRYIDGSGASFVDIEVDPLRFTPHLNLCARTNDAQVLSVFRELEVDSETFWSAASAVRAYFARNGDGDLVAPDCEVGLFAGQTEVDLALVQGGRLASPADYSEQIREWAKEVDVLLIKQHPYAAGAGPMSELANQIPNASLVSHNIYGMFSARNLRFVGALSSGAVRECEFFGVQGRALIKQDRVNVEQLPEKCSAWVTVPADIASMAAIEHMARNAPIWRRPAREHIKRVFDQDALDGIFGFRWGLNPDAPGLPRTRLVSHDSIYRFAQGGDAVAWLSTGWHDAENWGVWSSGHVCRLVLPLDREALQKQGSWRFEFLGRSFGNARVTEISLGDEIISPTWEAIGDVTAVRIEVPATRIDGPAAIALNLHIEGAARPVDVTGQPDARELGFGLEALRVSWAP